MIIETLVEKAKAARSRIAVGVAKGDEEKVTKSAQRAVDAGYADVVLVSARPLETGLQNITGELPEAALVGLLKRGEVDGIVRGTLDINPILSALTAGFGIKKLLRLAILRTPSGEPFLFAPVGIDDGWTIREKVALGIHGAQFLRLLGIEEDMGILGGGRKDDIGRSRVTDRSIRTAEKTAETLRKKGYNARCSYILIEDAIKRHNFIIAPDGISGNLIYRSLCLVGGGSGMGGPAVGAPFVYVDTSRAGRTYENAICTASALAGMRKEGRRPSIWP